MKLNSNVKAMTRKQAFEYVTKSLDDNPNSELEALYKYFMPSLPAKPKTAWQWVASAVGKKDMREYLNYLHSDGSVLYGSDGQRIHWCNTELGEGFYCPKTCNLVDLSGYYPQVQRIIDQTRPLELKVDLTKCETFSTQDERGNSLSRTRLNDDIVLDTQQLNQAVMGQSKITVQTRRERLASIQGSSKFGGWVLIPVSA
jgi:hypothetical protein